MSNKLLNLFKSSSYYFINSIVMQGLAFLLIPIYTSYLSTDQYGIVSMMTIFSAILVILLNVGQSNAIIRFSHAENDKNLFISNIVKYSLFVPLVISVLIIIVGDNLFSLIFKNIPFYPYGVITVFLAYFTSFNSIQISYYISRKDNKKYSIFNITRYIVMTFLAIILIVIFKLDAFGRLLAFAVSEAIYFFYSVISLKSYFKNKISTKHLKETLNYGILLVPHLIAGLILSSSDRYMLEFYLGLSDVGLYSLGYKLGTIPLIIATAFDKAWTPTFFENYKKNDSDKLFSEVAKYFIIILGFITLVTSLFSKEIIFVLAAESYHKAYSIIPLIAVGSFFVGIYFLPSKIFFYQKKTYILSLMTVIAAIVNIVMNIILIPKFGIIGAATSTLISYLIITTIVFYFSQKRYKIHYQLPKIIISLAVFIILYLMSIIVEQKYLVDNFYMMITLKISLVVAIHPVFRALNIITTDEIRKIKNVIIKRK